MEQLANRIAAALTDKGWCVIDDALPASLATALAVECDSDGFKPAGTGRQDAHHRDLAVRSDAIRWIDASMETGTRYAAAMDDLRGALNSRLLLGLLDYECHYARYAPGAFYGKHVDAFTGAKNRILSTVLYLNAGWRKEDGELLLYLEEGGVEAVLPQHNRLVLFLSERFPHEVRPATRERFSIAGWFRVRS